MELGLTAANALAHLFRLFRSTPTGSRAVEGSLKIVGLNSLAVAIRATAAGNAKIETSLQLWTADSAFEALLMIQHDDETFGESIEKYRFIAANTVGPTTREAAENRVHAFCEEWTKALLGEAGYVKEQLDAARDDRRQKANAATHAVLLEQFAGLRGLIESQSTTPTGAGAGASQKVNERLAEAREIMDRDPKRAREICRDLRKYETLTADDSFRVATNIGVASLRLKDLSTAEVELRVALELQPKNPKALSNAASVALRLDKVDDAVHLARRGFELDPGNGLTLLNYVDALRVAGDMATLAELLPQLDEWPTDTPLAGVTMLYLALDKFDEAEVMAKKAEEADPENPVALDLLASIYLVPRRGLLNINAEGQAKKAESLLDRAIAIAAQWETKTPLASVLFHRARTRVLLLKFDEALTDCTAAEINGGERDEIYLLRGLIYLEQREFDNAIAAFEQIADGDSRVDVAYPLAVALMAKGNTNRAIQLLERFLDDEPTSISFRGAADILISAYKAVQREADLDALLKRLDSLVTTVPALAPIVAHEMRRRGAVDAAFRTLEVAARVAKDPEERAFIDLHTANLLANEKRFAEAAKKYEEVLAFAPDVEASRDRVIALYNAGDVSNSLAAARELRGDGPAVPSVSELEAHILWETRDSLEAEKVLRLLAQSERQRKIHVIRAIKARADYDRAGAADEAGALSINDFGDAQELLEAAALRERLRLPNVLEWYYGAVAVAPFDEDTTRSFLGAYTRRRGVDEAKDPAVVTSDCAVTLRRGEDKRLIVIAPAPDRVIKAEYFASDSTFAVRLLGKREGDEVALTEDDEERGRLYSVEIITSRYALAWYQLMSAFPLRFPDSNVVTMGEGEAEIFAKLDQREAHYRRVLALYESRIVSLNAAADMLGTSVVQAWGSVVGDVARPLRAAIGSSEEAVAEEAAMRSDGLVVDLTAALTLDYLGLAEPAFDAFSKILIPRRVIDELEQVLLNEFSSDDESLAVGKENDRYVARERTADDQRAGRETIERLLALLQKHGDVLPHGSLIELRREDVEKLLRRLGETSLAVLLVAKQQEAAVLSDDVVTRITGFARWQLPSLGTQALLLHLRGRGSVSNEQYLDALVKLSDIGYNFLRVGADDMFSVLRRENFSLTPSKQRLFRSLEGPECDAESSAQIVAELLERLYAETILPANIAVVIDFLCNTHAAGRDAGVAMSRLKALASSRLAGRPRARVEVIRACDRVAATGRLHSIANT